MEELRPVSTGEEYGRTRDLHMTGSRTAGLAMSFALLQAGCQATPPKLVNGPHASVSREVVQASYTAPPPQAAESSQPLPVPSPGFSLETAIREAPASHVRLQSEAEKVRQAEA